MEKQEINRGYNNAASVIMIKNFSGCLHLSWTDILTSLKNYESFFFIADSHDLLQKLISSLLLYISNSGTPFTSSSSFSSSSSSSVSLHNRQWWFDDLTALSPTIILKIARNLNGINDKSCILTSFLLHYLNSTGHVDRYKLECSEIANTIVNVVVLMARGWLSCRRLFWVLRVVTDCLDLSSNSRRKLEEMIGERLDEAKLDDMLVSGHDVGVVYDVNLVIRLVRIFVKSREDVSIERMRRVEMLMDMYLKEISPDKSLSVSNFAEVVESLPDSARECFDGVYGALDIYIEAHADLSFEERTMLCQSLNCKKLTLEASKELARNPKIPPEVSIRALVSRLSNLGKRADMPEADDAGSYFVESADEEKEEAMLNFGMMQWRLCRDVRSNKMTKNVNRSKIMSYNVGD